MVSKKAWSLSEQENDDIDQLIEAMRKQFNDMRQDYHDQIEYIEAAFIRERSEIIQRNGEEIGGARGKVKSRLYETFLAEKAPQNVNVLVTHNSPFISWDPRR